MARIGPRRWVVAGLDAATCEAILPELDRWAALVA